MRSLRTPAAVAVADVLADVRKQKGLTQRALAERVGRPHSVIGMIESRQRQVTVPELIALAEALGVDPLDFFKRVLRAKSSR